MSGVRLGFNGILLKQAQGIGALRNPGHLAGDVGARGLAGLGRGAGGLGLAGHAPGGLGGEGGWAAGRGCGGNLGGTGVRWGLAGFGGAPTGQMVPFGQQTPNMEAMMEWGLNMMKRMNEEDGKGSKRRKKKDCVDDNDEEEELEPVSFIDVKGEDDGQARICWDLRNGKLLPYNGGQKEFWERQPRVSHPIRESYLDSHLRLDPVNPQVTLRDHDRGAKRTIKQYAKVNFQVVKSSATIRSVGLESHDVGLAKDYEECTGAYQLVSALWQYAINLFLVRRDDYSGLVMLKVLHDVKFFQPVLMSKVVGKKQRDSKQVEVIRHFIDMSMERNSMMGKQGKPPLPYEELLKIARGAANLIYAGTGVGLDWGVDTGTCSIDPYTLADSSSSGTPDGNNNSGGGGGRSRNGNQRGGGGQGGFGQGSVGQAGGQGGGQGGGRAAGGQGAQRAGGVGAGTSAVVGGRSGVQWCKDWNRGACRYLIAGCMDSFKLDLFRFPNACNYTHRCNKVLKDGTSCDKVHKARDHR